MTHSTEQDIVDVVDVADVLRRLDLAMAERDGLRCAVGTLRAERDALQSNDSDLRWNHLQPALSRITELEAERDAAARDMRERCAKVAESLQLEEFMPNGQRVVVLDAPLVIADAIRALPLAVVATERADG